MQVIFESGTHQATGLKESAVRRARLSLRTLAWLVARARIRLTTVKDARNGIDKRCQVELFTDGMDPVVVSSISRHWHVALQSALTRAASSLLFSWSRQRGFATRTPLLA